MNTFHESLETLFNYRYITLVDPEGHQDVIHVDWLNRYCTLLPEWNTGNDMGLEADEIDFFLALCPIEVESIEPDPDCAHIITHFDGSIDIADQIVHLRRCLPDRESEESF